MTSHLRTTLATAVALTLAALLLPAPAHADRTSVDDPAGDHDTEVYASDGGDLRGASLRVTRRWVRVSATSVVDRQMELPEMIKFHLDTRGGPRPDFEAYTTFPGRADAHLTRDKSFQPWDGPTREICRPRASRTSEDGLVTFAIRFKRGCLRSAGRTPRQVRMVAASYGDEGWLRLDWAPGRKQYTRWVRR